MVTLKLLEFLAFLMVIATLLISGRLLIYLVLGLRRRSYLLVCMAVIGVLLILGALAMVVIVWFSYAVAHTGKDATTDLMVVLVTVPPFFLLAIVLWALCNRMGERLLNMTRNQQVQGDHDSAKSTSE